MNISPRRRRRILEAQRMRQSGLSLRDIADSLGVSPATVHADLKLLETHWSDVTAQAADDLLLEHLAQLRERIGQLLRHDPEEIFSRFIVSAGGGYYRTWTSKLSAADLVRLHQARAAELTTLFRETRRTIQDIHRRARERRAETAETSAETTYPDDELTDRRLWDELDIAEPSQTELNDPEHPNPAFSQPEQQIADPDPTEKNQPEHPPTSPALTPAPAAPDDLYAQIIANGDRLKGMDDNELLAFLDEFSPGEPNPDEPNLTPTLHAEAAGGG